MQTGLVAKVKNKGKPEKTGYFALSEHYDVVYNCVPGGITIVENIMPIKKDEAKKLAAKLRDKGYKNARIRKTKYAVV